MLSKIKTERLVLRNWKLSDKEPFYQMNSDQDVMRFFPSVLNKAESDFLFEKIQSHIDQFGYGLFAVEEKGTGQFIGFIGLNKVSFESDFTPCVEMVWRLIKECWRKGYATEGAKVILKKAFSDYYLDRVVSFTSLNNQPSIRVMEKIGLTFKMNFDHPFLPKEHALTPHVLYELRTTHSCLT